MQYKKMKIHTADGAKDFTRGALVAYVADNKPQLANMMKTRHGVTLPANITDREMLGAIYKGVKVSTPFRKDIIKMVGQGVKQSYSNYVDEMMYASGVTGTTGSTGSVGKSAMVATHTTGSMGTNNKPINSGKSGASVKKPNTSILNSMVVYFRQLFGGGSHAGADGSFANATDGSTDPVLSSASKSYTDTTFGQIFSPDRLGNIFEQGLTLIGQDLQQKAAKGSEQNAIDYELAQSQKYQAQAVANNEAAKAKKAGGWILPVTIGVLVLGGVFAAIFLSNKAKAKKAAAKLGLGNGN